VRVTWGDRTEGLVRLPFIRRRGKRAFYYRSEFGEYARRVFGRLSDVTEVRRKLVLAAQH
jgi:hypothetical protein